MQHIEINDASHCTIVNVEGAAIKQEPAGNAARSCSQCDRLTWRRTAVCMHCGFDRWARYRVAATTAAGATALAMVIFHPLT